LPKGVTSRPKIGGDVEKSPVTELERMGLTMKSGWIRGERISKYSFYWQGKKTRVGWKKMGSSGPCCLKG